jgi:hypothetical protein
MNKPRKSISGDTLKTHGFLCHVPAKQPHFSAIGKKEERRKGGSGKKKK